MVNKSAKSPKTKPAKRKATAKNAAKPKNAANPKKATKPRKGASLVDELRLAAKVSAARRLNK